MVNFENGKTLLNDTNLNKIQTDLMPVTLYENQTGTTENITLSESTANFLYIEIFYRNDNYTYQSVKVSNANGKKVSLLSTSLDSNSASNFKLKDISISDKQITNLYCQNLNFWGGEWHNTDATNNIYITKVLGYKN